MEALIVRWREIGTTHRITETGPGPETFQAIEEVLRNQRGTVDRLHQLWIEYAQASGYHAPQ